MYIIYVTLSNVLIFSNKNLSREKSLQLLKQVRLVRTYRVGTDISHRYFTFISQLVLTQSNVIMRILCQFYF